MKGTVYEPEARTYLDRVSGRTVTQLTDYFGHSTHLYFTNNTFYGNDMIFRSQRHNQTNLFRLRMDTKTIVQLSDLPRCPYDIRFHDRSHLSYVHEGNSEVYIFYANKLYAVHLETLEQRVLYEAPEGFALSSGSPSADGKYVMQSIYEETVKREEGFGFYDTWAAFPLTRILRVETSTGYAEQIYEERYWIKHINMSPTVPNVMTFCHEGPWDRVDHRIWLLNTDTGHTSKVVLDHGPEKTSGHEYWFVDGIHIGYHGNKCRQDGSVHGYYGCIKYDNTDCTEFDFPFQSQHFHSNDFDLIVGDGKPYTNPYILLWKRHDDGFSGPKVLALHRSSAYNAVATHVHPRFTPDGNHVVYTSDTSGYGNVYIVEVGNTDDLPSPQNIQAL